MVYGLGCAGLEVMVLGVTSMIMVSIAVHP